MLSDCNYTHTDLGVVVVSSLVLSLSEQPPSSLDMDPPAGGPWGDLRTLN